MFGLNLPSFFNLFGTAVARAGTRLYMQYAECLKKYFNEVDGAFYDVIINSHARKTI